MWYLIDVAEPDRGIRYMPEEGMARERSLLRAIRPSSLAVLANSALAQAIESNEQCAREVRIRGELHGVLAVPVAGPDGKPMAVQLWAGARPADRVDPPGIDVFVWDDRQWTLMSHGSGGAVLPAGHELLHGAWFLSRIIECEERDRLITAALDPRPGVEWQGPMRMLTVEEDRTTRVFGFFRYHGPHALRGLLLQGEAERAAGIVLPTYHNDAAAALLGGTTALIDIESMQIIEWLTPPLAAIAWRHHPASKGMDPADRDEFNLATTHLIHPDDRECYLAVMAELAAHRIEYARAVVRLLTVDRDWLRVELYCIRLPRGLPRFLACLIRPVGAETPTGVVSGQSVDGAWAIPAYRTE
ncbi:hypothetical protein [Nocardia sp. NBC_00403]|uniref:hypothetical protein n=1 Tax=Nocardia sp. NBC_00403 TaxID=2975990 RepID=UPI002E21177E